MAYKPSSLTRAKALKNSAESVASKAASQLTDMTRYVDGIGEALSLIEAGDIHAAYVVLILSLAPEIIDIEMATKKADKVCGEHLESALIPLYEIASDLEREMLEALVARSGLDPKKQ